MNHTLPPMRTVIVEDREADYKSLRDYLEARGHVRVVGWARDVSEAQAIIRRERPKILIVDLELANHTIGTDLLATLDRNKLEDEAIVLVTTMIAGDAMHRLAYKRKADKVIVKDDDATRTAREVQKYILEFSGRISDPYAEFDEAPVVRPSNRELVEAFLIWAGARPDSNTYNHMTDAMLYRMEYPNGKYSIESVYRSWKDCFPGLGGGGSLRRSLNRFVEGLWNQDDTERLERLLALYTPSISESAGTPSAQAFIVFFCECIRAQKWNME